ncbi:MAG: M48 family metallopeptidase [Alistipes finegoldii]
MSAESRTTIWESSSPGSGKTNSVRYKGPSAVCTSPTGLELMRSWCSRTRQLKFAEYAEPIISRFARYGVAPTTLCPGDGNCRGQLHPQGKIILNTESSRRIEYVITHEMCHLLHPDHTAAPLPC